MTKPGPDPADTGMHRRNQPMTRRLTVDPRDTTGLDVSHLLTPEHRAHMAGLGPKYAMFAGVTMKEEDPDPDPDEEEEEEEDEDTDPDEEIRVGGKVLKVGDISRLMAREKRQGKRSGQTQLAKDLGFDSVDAMKAAVAGIKPKKKAKDDDGADDEAAERAAEAERKATAREEAANLKARKSDLRGALREYGVAREDLDEAYALLDRRVDADYEDDDIEDAIEELVKTRAGKALLDADDDDDKKDPPKRTPAASVPRGRGPRGRQKPQPKEAGAGGRARARERGWIKDDA